VNTLFTAPSRRLQKNPASPAPSLAQWWRDVQRSNRTLGKVWSLLRKGFR
jgi:hypothetical protein